MLEMVNKRRIIRIPDERLKFLSGLALCAIGSLFRAQPCCSGIWWIIKIGTGDG